MAENQLTKIAVYRKDIDSIVGLVNLRDLLLAPQASLEKLVKPVEFVPEQKSVESLLEFFRESKTDTAIVVDEYGGISGQVSLEDIVEELIGPLEETPHVEAVRQIGPMKYRLDGDLSIHDWGSIFGIDPAQSRLSTVGGLTTALLGKIPSPGDVATLKNLTFTVEKVRKRRIESLILSLEPIDKSETNT
ncbi:MAG: CBS domain-containing protein [Planctomycetes bacterium]|nr:CBS domain-containing protein [Planctomycetota bacterium]